MFRGLIYLFSFVLVVSLVLSSPANAADPDLHGWWRFDEGSGTTASDFSEYGNNGTLQNGPVWAAGKIGGALQFDGVDDFVQVPHHASLTASTEVTVMAWINTSRHGGPGTEGWQGIIAKGNSPRSYSFYTESGGGLHFSIGPGGAYVGTVSSTRVPLNEWVHVCAMVRGGQHQYYINGEDAGTGGAGTVLPGAQDTADVVIGRTQEGATRSFLGRIDDPRIYTRALTQDEVRTIMLGEGIPYATNPNPPDGGTHLDTWVTLSWRAGDFAASHDVYLGDNLDDVNNGTGDTFRGNQTSTYYVAGFPGFAYPDGLVPGTTYYWRIDEVNNADPNSPWKGEIWRFSVPSKKAYNPNPPDGAEYVMTDVTLSWTGGLGAKLHTVYFGDNRETVTNAVGGLPQATTTYKPAALQSGKTYYWRVDEFDAATTHKGNVWSFTTLPNIAVTDPTLMGWWKLDEGLGTTAVDWSGHGRHGRFQGDPEWVSGYDGGAVEFDGDDHVDTGYTENLATYTITCWARSPQAPSGASPSGPLHREQNYQFNWNHGDATFRGAAAMNVGGTWHAASYMPLEADTWYHLAATYDGNVFNAYRNGVLITSNPAPSGAPNAESNSLKLGRHAAAAQFFTGIVDDARVYNRALTVEEIQQTMRGDPFVAWNPNPSNGSTPYIADALPLSWSPGDKASQHDVYFGTDADGVKNADASDATGIYRGRQSAATYTPPEGVEWGGGPYYWRIDEVNADATVSKGRIWTFTVVDFRLIDDFESYDAADNQIWYSWHDGLGYGTPGTPDYFPGNGTGSAVGDENTPSFTEETIVHGGRQSMPVVYDNNKQGVAKYSEVELKLTAPRNWTEEGVGELSIWFRGLPGSVGSFTEAPAGTYTMTASGTDIWDVGTAGNYHDEFHFAYKTLTGAGSIVARVQSVQNTNGWAKAGVMIRQTLDGNSRHTFACITPSNGVAQQGRPDTGAASFNANQTGIAAPHWVKLERDLSGNFTVSHSANGTTWQPVTGATPQNIQMGSNVYIGLALTAHNATATCQAVFTNVTTTGTVSPQWAHQDIGIASNATEPLYVAVSNATGQPAVVVHPDPAAATITTWTEWVAPLSAFSDKGINLTNVDRLALGLGTRGNQTVPGGSGKMYFDDIRLYRP